MKACAVPAQYTPQRFTDAKNTRPPVTVELPAITAVELSLSTTGVRYPI